MSRTPDQGRTIDRRERPDGDVAWSAATDRARDRGPTTWTLAAPLGGYLRSQFHRPRGPLGVLAGRIMSQRGTNVDRNRWLIDLLGLEADHRVLELGPGPGVAIAAAASRVTRGELVAIDHSITMLRQAAGRNRSLVDEGRLTLIEADVGRLPAGLGEFDRIYAMNVWHFWDDQEAVLGDLAALLRPGGRLAIGYQPRHRGASGADADAGRRCLRDQFLEVGLTGIEDHTLAVEPPVCCVVGRRDTAFARRTGPGVQSPP